MIEAADTAMRDAKSAGGGQVFVDPGSASRQAGEPLHSATEIISERYARARKPSDEEIQQLMRQHELTEAEAILLAAGRLRRPPA